jgi:hypothetical protein
LRAASSVALKSAPRSAASFLSAIEHGDDRVFAGPPVIGNALSIELAETLAFLKLRRVGMGAGDGVSSDRRGRSSRWFDRTTCAAHRIAADEGNHLWPGGGLG